MPNIAHVNGRFMPLSKARVSVEDRGFQLGDGIYELIRTYNGELFQVDAHLGRLERSAEAIGLDHVYSRPRWRTLLENIRKRCGFKEAKLYIQLTRGTAPRDHVFPKRARTSVVITARQLISSPSILRQRGAVIITVPDMRWGRCDIKSINLLPNIMARQKAKAEGAYEALFVREGVVTEGSSSNVFALIAGRLVTPPSGPLILSGITRECVLRLAKEEGLPITERDFSLEELRRGGEVFLTGTTVEILPVVRIDGRLICNGRPGPITRLLCQRFRALTGE